MFCCHRFFGLFGFIILLCSACWHLPEHTPAKTDQAPDSSGNFSWDKLPEININWISPAIYTKIRCKIPVLGTEITRTYLYEYGRNWNPIELEFQCFDALMVGLSNDGYPASFLFGAKLSSNIDRGATARFPIHIYYNGEYIDDVTNNDILQQFSAWYFPTPTAAPTSYGLVSRMGEGDTIRAIMEFVGTDGVRYKYTTPLLGIGIIPEPVPGPGSSRRGAQMKKRVSGFLGR